MPEISIILPVYNAEAFLSDTLNSILSQTFQDFELICIDDGSSDGTAAILDGAALLDSRIHVVHQLNGGPGVARNKGIDLARGVYIMMLDADDLYEPNMLESLHVVAERNASDVVVCRSSEFDNSTHEEHEALWTLNANQIPNKACFTAFDMPDFIFTAFLGWPWDKLYRRSLIEKHHLRFPHLSNSEDLFLVFLALVKAEGISICDQTLIKHRVNRGSSVSGSRAKAPLDFYKSTCLLKEELKKDLETYAKIGWGFLNWAFQYMVWNIESMEDAPARRLQLNALTSGSFKELEIEKHSPAFYSLIPSVYDRYLNLLIEAKGIDNNSDRPQKESWFLTRLISVLQRLNRYGILGSIKKIPHFIIKRTNRSIEIEPVQIRSSDFCLTSDTIYTLFDNSER